MSKRESPNKDLADAKNSPAPTPKAASPAKQPILLLFDLDETLIYRSVFYVRVPRALQEPCASVKNRSIYARDGAPNVLSALISDPRVKIGVLTTMQRDNAEAIIENLLKQGGKSRAALFAVFPREFHVPDEDKDAKRAGDEFSRKRNLEAVWATDKCIEAGFGVKNTICINNEFRKIRDYPHNAIVIPSYSEEKVREKDTVLPKLQRYLEELLEKCDDDVREYIKNNAFEEDIRSAYAPSEEWSESKLERLLQKEKTDKEVRRMEEELAKMSVGRFGGRGRGHGRGGRASGSH